MENTESNGQLSNSRGGARLDQDSSQRARANPSQGSRPNNIVIDIESEDLTFNQARQIRLQIEKDVEQLRNRVRMLKTEEQRACKKIDQTKKKTRTFLELQAKNDMDYRRKTNEENQQKRFQQHRQGLNVERHNKAMRDVRVRSSEVHSQKMNAVNEFRATKNALKDQLKDTTVAQSMKNHEQRHNIQMNKQMGVVRQNEFMMKKQLEARRGVNDKANVMSKQIYDYELEAQQLEKMEADLLVKLQETQKMERDAFVKLESAMVDASIPKNVRKMAGTSFNGAPSNA